VGTAIERSSLDRPSVLEAFRRTGAMLEGHFQLSSGLHSDRYFQCALVLERPSEAEALAKELARQVRAAQPAPFDVVIGPALGAVTWAYEVARALGCRGQFAERRADPKADPKSGERMELRRGFRIEPGARVLVVEDVLTTGGSAREVLELLATLGVKAAGVGCIVNRSGGNPFAKDGLPLFALAEVEVKTWQPAACPLCAQGSPAVKPGSRPGS
jgi:orotate phosphoribosyltransferase